MKYFKNIILVGNILKTGEHKMSAEHNDEVIVFENLVQPTGVIGKFESVTAVKKVTEPFVNSNAVGHTRSVEGRDEVGLIAKQSGLRLKKIFA